MAYAIPGLNGLQAASWLKAAMACPHCQQRPDLHLRYDMNVDGEGMVIGCGGKTDKCMRFPIQSMERFTHHMDKLYESRHNMAKMLVIRWNEHHIETPEYLEGHA